MKQRELFSGVVVKDRVRILAYLAQCLRILAGEPPKGEANTDETV